MTHLPKFTLWLKNVPRIYHCEPGWRWSPPPLTDYDLWCVLAGEGTMLLAGQSYALRPGVCFVVPPGAEPSATQNPHHRLQVFAVHFEPLDDRGIMLNPFGPSFLGWSLQDKAFFETLARRCAISAEREEEGLSRRQTVLYVEQMLLHLWEESARPTTDPRDDMLRQIHAEIRAAPGEDWNIATQAERACLSRSQYTRRFILLFGIAPHRFVIQCRLDRASQLLLETDMTVSEIALVLGYRDLFFFSRQFKTHFGMSPGMRRRSDRVNFSERDL